ncbi:BCCT family transporter [Desertibacillus haloalkaliphilus]|uniref:BCCT family transporter n=1 Tax=Desertibacillus haloalkaliphilus TaxID=1328930 RepID=UPI001C272376|nr:BCCT family transporter [Desertibacillus haloalkaliphilus]MBU8906864.1 BCCT family transporter [Desertibacillus haloalkaliphilus]
MKYTYKEKKPGSVFYISAILVAMFVLWGFISPSSLDHVASNALNATIENFGWFYMVVAAFFVGFVIFLAVSPYGRLRLGKPDDRPEYNFYTWVGMLFSAGIGVGFVFWGVAEPVLYYVDTPHGVIPETAEAARVGLRYAIYHWALHPWAIFSLVALALAYVQYRKDQPALISSAFYPLFGKRMDGWFGRAIDILAVLATSTGVATTFGLSAMQISGGLSYLTNIPNTVLTQMIIIVIVTILFMFSAASGLNKGIKYLSIINLTTAAILLLFILIAGPTLFIFENMVTALGGYITNLVPMSLTLTPYTDSVWLGSFTIFYWAWHIAWAPFMGLFIARISRGRTIREFMAGVLIVPTLLAIIWFSAFGGSALHIEVFGNGGIADIVLENVELALFATLGEFPLGSIMSLLAVILILIFFITSADSASYVLGAMTSRGSLNPTMGVKIVWGFLIAGTASVLLLSGGLGGLQTASIVAALPFAVIMILMVISIIVMMSKDLKLEKRKFRKKQRELIKEEILEELEEEYDLEPTNNNEDDKN